MLNSYFGFSCSPFENTLDQQFLFLSECHEEVIAALLYFIREKKSFALVCGDVGTGKTMIVHYVLANLPPSVLPILIPYPDVEYIEILRYIARVLNVNPEGKGILELTDELKAALTRTRLDGKQVVLIIDEAHLLSKSSLEYIRLASNIETTENKLLQTLLIGQNELSHKLRGRDMRQFRQRISINRVLCPMSPSETIAYTDHRLKIAGSSFDRCFDAGCRKPLYEMTGGVPRSINRLCDTALLICMTERRDKVTRRILNKARDAIDSDIVRVPEAPVSAAFFHSKKFKAAFATVALILLIVFGVLGYGERLKAWFYGPDVRKEANTAVEEQRAPASEETSRVNPPAPAGKDGSSDPMRGPGDVPDPMSAPASPPVPPGETEAIDNPDKGVTEHDNVSSPGMETGSSPAAPEKTETEGQAADKNHESARIPGDGADQKAASETVTPDAAIQGTPAEEITSESSDFIIVTVKKGESLNQIAARWFPEDPESGKKSILAANPQIDDEDLILAGQTLRLPKPMGAGLEEK